MAVPTVTTSPAPIYIIGKPITLTFAGLTSGVTYSVSSSVGDVLPSITGAVDGSATLTWTPSKSGTLTFTNTASATNPNPFVYSVVKTYTMTVKV